MKAPKHLKLAMASRRAAFIGNTSLIATFSSLGINLGMSGLGLGVQKRLVYNRCIREA